MLGVHERGRAAQLLRLGNDLQCERRLTRRLRTVDLHDAASRQATDTQRDVQPDRTCRNSLYIPDDAAVSHTHDRSLAELLFDLAEGLRECFLAIFIHYFWSV